MSGAFVKLSELINRSDIGIDSSNSNSDKRQQMFFSP